MKKRHDGHHQHHPAPRTAAPILSTQPSISTKTGVSNWVWSWHILKQKKPVSMVRRGTKSCMMPKQARKCVEMSDGRGDEELVGLRGSSHGLDGKEDGENLL